MEYYNALVQARETLVLVSEDNEALLETEVYKDLNSAITTMSESLEDYINKRYEEEKLNYMAQNGIPQTVEEYNAMKSAMDKVAGTSEGLKSKFNDLLTTDFSYLANSLDSVAKSGEKLSNNTSSFNIETFSNTIQSYEDGYKHLIEAQEEWNNAKSISAETFADLQESGLLEYLEFTAEGLTVNTNKLLENAQATKDKAVADLHASMMADMLKIALGNVDSVSEEAKVVIAQLGDNTEIAGEQAINSVGNWATLGAVITDTMARARGEDRGFNGVSDEQKAQMESVYNYYHDMAEKVSAIDITVPNRTQKAKDSAKKTSDEYLKAFEKELDALKLLQKSGLINESEYLSRLKRLYNRYFAERKEYLDEFQKYEREYLEGMESLYNSAISAVVKLKDKKIDSVKESKESVIENLEAEKDASDEAYQAQIDAIKNLTDEKERYIDGIKAEIDSIQGVIDGYNEQIDLINAEIKAKREANDERKRALDLEQAQFDLEKKRNNKTIRQYTQNGIIYTEDLSVVREAEQKVEDAKLEIEIAEKEKEISQIEELIKQKEKEIEQKEKSISLIEKEIDVLDKQAESIQKAQEESEKYYDNLIKQQENYYNSLIENLEKEKSKWEELAEVKEVADAYSAIEQVFGDLGYTVDDVLSNSMGAFEDFKAKYIDLLNTMNSNDSFGNGLSYAVDELDKSLANVGTNTEGLDNLVSKMDDVTTSVSNVSNAINGSGMSSMSSGEEVSNATGSSLKDAIADQTNDALTKLEEQSNAFSNGEDSLKGSVQNVIDKVAGSSEGKDKKDSKEGESEVDTDNLVGAIQAQYDKTVETIPQQIESFNLFESAIGGCVTQLHAMIEALKEVQTLSSSIGMMGTVPINGYATGTTHAKKGLSIVGEEEPELIEHNNGNLSLVTEPTLLNMEGGEKVYNGEETKSLLNPKQKQMLQDFMKHGLVRDDVIVNINEDESPLLKARNLNLVQDAWSMQMQNLLSSPKPIQTVNNRTQTIEQHNQFNVTLPNINDSSKAVQLANELKRLPLQTMQYAHRR